MGEGGEWGCATDASTPTSTETTFAITSKGKKDNRYEGCKREIISDFNYPANKGWMQSAKVYLHTHIGH